MNISPVSWSRTLTVLGSGVAVFAPTALAIFLTGLNSMLSTPAVGVGTLSAIPVIGFFFFAFVVGEVSTSIGEYLLGKYFNRVGKNDRLYGEFRAKIDPFDDDFLYILDLNNPSWTKEYEIMRHRIDAVSGLSGALILGAPLAFAFALTANIQGYDFELISFFVIGFLSFCIGVLTPLTATILTSRFTERLSLFHREEQRRRDPKTPETNREGLAGSDDPT